MSARPTYAVLVGSLQRRSLSRALANSLPDLCPLAANFAHVPGMGELPLYDEDLEARGLPQVALDAGRAIERADGVVIVTPEHNRSIPAGLKNLLDWIARLAPQPLVGKAVVLQSVSAHARTGALVQAHLREVLLALDARVLERPDVTLHGAAPVFANGRLADSGIEEMIAAQLGAFATFAAISSPAQS